jgi:hypothetical protein
MIGPDPTEPIMLEASRSSCGLHCTRRGLIDLKGKPDSARTLMNTFRRDLVAANPTIGAIKIDLPYQLPSCQNASIVARGVR